MASEREGGGWVIYPSLWFDALCLVPLLAGLPFYTSPHEEDTREWRERFAAAAGREALDGVSVLRREVADGAGKPLPAFLSLWTSPAAGAGDPAGGSAETAAESLDGLIAAVADPERLAAAMRETSPHWNEADDRLFRSVRPALLAALLDRDRTGRGGLIEFAQAENVMQEVGEFFLDRQFNQRNPPVRGNSDPHMLQGAFPAAEDDRWVAISVRSDRDWDALTTVIGSPAWSGQGATAAERLARAAELREHIAGWTKALPAAEIVGRLQRAGVPAGEVMTETRLLEDEHLAARDWFKERSHPSVGTYRYPGNPWRASGFDVAFGRPLPGFGEDNEYVYKTLLGYSDDRYDDLVRRGLVTTEQFA